eukprot:15362676-Ditylum_brightwellii.AAC.1
MLSSWEGSPALGGGVSGTGCGGPSSFGSSAMIDRCKARSAVTAETELLVVGEGCGNGAVVGIGGIVQERQIKCVEDCKKCYLHRECLLSWMAKVGK